MSVLAGRIAVVTGASRGIGRGIAIELGAAGATVYVTGRTVKPGVAALPGTIGETADLVTKGGGRGITRSRCGTTRWALGCARTTWRASTARR